MDPLCISLVHQYLESTNSTVAEQFKSKYHTVCLRGGVQKKFLFWVNQWFYLVSLVQKIGDPSGAHQFLAFLPIFMAKNCPKKP